MYVCMYMYIPGFSISLSPPTVVIFAQPKRKRKKKEEGRKEKKKKGLTDDSPSYPKLSL